MITLRQMRWDEDREAILALDTSFTTERVYRVIVSDSAFRLEQATVSPALQKVYDLSKEIEQFPSCDFVVVAEQDGRVVGVAALENDAPDRRAVLRHLYIDRPHRGKGIGRALMDAIITRAEEWGARCVWLETQDVNYDAIRFYKQAGFEWCGLDRSLDEHDGSETDETAVFYMRRSK
jgi:GNAT superfamily N-acetyltransferase